MIYYIRLFVIIAFAYLIYLAIELHHMRVSISDMAGSLYNIDNRMND